MGSINKNSLIWFVPAIVLFISLIPVLFLPIFVLALQIIVSVSAAYICYLLLKSKPKNYLFWAIAFILVVLVFNPIVHIVMMGNFGIPLALLAGILFLANWWFVFK